MRAWPSARARLKGRPVPFRESAEAPEVGGRKSWSCIPELRRGAPCGNCRSRVRARGARPHVGGPDDVGNGDDSGWWVERRERELHDEVRLKRGWRLLSTPSRPSLRWLSRGSLSSSCGATRCGASSSTSFERHWPSREVLMPGTRPGGGGRDTAPSRPPIGGSGHGRTRCGDPARRCPSGDDLDCPQRGSHPAQGGGGCSGCREGDRTW